MGRGFHAGEKTLGNVRCVPWTTISEMELVAAVQALRIFPTDRAIELHSDSEYLIYGMRVFVFHWQRQGWRNRRGNQLAAPRVMVGVGRVECTSFPSVGHGSRDTTGIATRAVPTSSRMKPPALSVCNRR